MAYKDQPQVGLLYCLQMIRIDILTRWWLAAEKEEIMANYLTYDERLTIQQMLKEGQSFSRIAAYLHRDPGTIAREIKKYAVTLETGRPGYPYNPCRNRMSCRARGICGPSCARPSLKKCSICAECTGHCPDFAEEICTSRFRIPYVCNACGTISKCTLRKTFYDAQKAHLKAHQVISESRSGLSTNEEEIARLNRIISPLVRQGHSVHEICVTHRDELMCSEKTIYNYIDDSLFDVRNINLPRKVRYRPRRKQPEFKVDKGCRIGRTYKDFEAFREEHPDIADFR